MDRHNLNHQWQIEDVDISILVLALGHFLSSQENAREPEETRAYREQLFEVLKDINLSITFQECNILLQMIPKPRPDRKTGHE